MAGVDNLVTLTPEEAREQGRKGGIASGKARRERRQMRETLQLLLDMPMKAGKSVDVEEIKNYAKLKGKNISVQEAMLIAQVQKAMRGDTKAAEFIRDTAGQKPVENVDMNVNKLPIVICNEDDLED